MDLFDEGSVPAPFVPENLESTMDLEDLESGLGEAFSEEDLAECMETPSCLRFLDWYQWTESLPVELLEEALVQQAPQLLDSGLPLPPALPDYPTLSDSGRREAWRVWYLFAFLEQQRNSVLPSIPSGGLGVEAASSGGQSVDFQEGPGAAHDLSGFWRLEGHGTPLKLIPGGTQDATILVTTRGLLHFPEPGARPDWMVRSPASVREAVPVLDDNGNVEQIVMRALPSWQSNDPSVIVVDAKGEVGFTGFAGRERLLFWDLTDVDGDDQLDILGLDGNGNAVAVKLDGTQIYSQAIPGLPHPGPVSPPLVPVYLSIAYSNNGSPLLGDVDGDGTLDFIVPGLYNVVVLVVVTSQWLSATNFQAFSGKDFELLWVQASPPTWGSAWSVPLDVGDVTGDGKEDILVYNYEAPFVFVPGVPVYPRAYSYGFHVLAGADGTTVIRDTEHRVCTPLGCESTGQLPFQAIGLIDADGDGRKVLLAIESETGPIGAPSAFDLVLRGPTVPGGPSEELERHPVSLSEGGSLVHMDLRVRPAPAGGELVWIDANYLEGEGIDRQFTSTHRLLEEGSMSKKKAQQGMGYVGKDPRSGQLFGWSLERDQWTPLDDDLDQQGNGTRLVVSVEPMLFHDENGDEVPDMLVRTSLGYRWVDGSDGSHLGHADRLPGNIDRKTSMQEGLPVVWEWDYYEQKDSLYGLDGTLHWSHDRDDGRVLDIADVTGDGILEALVRDDDQIFLKTMPDGKEIWSSPYTYQDVVSLRDMDFERGGMEIVRLGAEQSGDGEEPEPTAAVTGWKSGVSSPHHQELSVEVPEQDDPLWVLELEDRRLETVDKGIVVLRQASRDHEDADRMDMLEGSSGELIHTMVVAQPSDPDWSRHMMSVHLVDLTANGTGELVYLYRDFNADHNEPVYRQGVQISDALGNRTLGQMRISDPLIRENSGWNSFEFNSFSISVGDWNGDGMGDLAFVEHGVPVVRDSVGGEPLAVGPRGSFVSAVDLEGDGQKDVALLQPGRLRMLTYVEGGGLMGEEENPVERLTDLDEQGRAQGKISADSGSSNFLPAPGVVWVGLLLAGLVLLSRRRNNE